MERGGILAGWNPWHGCHQISEGCRHCYVFRMDGRYGRLPDTVRKNREFDLPIQKNRNGAYKIPSGEVVYTCFTSDFFLEDADPWRAGCLADDCPATGSSFFYDYQTNSSI